MSQNDVENESDSSTCHIVLEPVDTNILGVAIQACLQCLHAILPEEFVFQLVAIQKLSHDQRGLLFRIFNRTAIWLSISNLKSKYQHLYGDICILVDALVKKHMLVEFEWPTTSQIIEVSELHLNVKRRARLFFGFHY
eukprot:Platyproteum_vivax@DN10800_c0_g1_i1.p1